LYRTLPLENQRKKGEENDERNETRTYGRQTQMKEKEETPGKGPKPKSKKRKKKNNEKNGKHPLSPTNQPITDS